MLRFGDRSVRHTIGKYELHFPFSHNYPIDSLLQPRESTNLSRLALLAKGHFRNFSLIDIGANVGDTVAELRNADTFPILAVEGDADYYRYLEENVGSWENITTVQALLGEEEQEITGRLAGNYGGSKQIVHTGESGETIAVQTLDILLEHHPDFRSARMVKIDTDGYDPRIIRGARQWLAETRPVLFFEYDPHHLAEQNEDGLSLFPLLAKTGYRWLLLFEGNGDFMFSGTLDDDRFLQETHAYFSGRASKKYADICLFPTTEKDLFEQSREQEMQVAVKRGTAGKRV